MDVVIEPELEVAVESHIEPLPSSEKVFVIDGQLRGYSHQAGGIGGHFEISLEALQLGV